jgi:hypothetical protein
MTSHQLARMLLQNADCDVTYYDGEETVTVNLVDFSEGADLCAGSYEACLRPITREAFEEDAFRKVARASWGPYEFQRSPDGNAFIWNIQTPKGY